MNYEFLAAARLEFEEAFDYYEDQREGLGVEFAVFLTASFIKRNAITY